MIGGSVPSIRKIKGICSIVFHGVRIHYFLAALRYIVSACRDSQIIQYILISIKIKTTFAVIMCKCSCGGASGFYGFNPFPVVMLCNLFNCFSICLFTNTAGVSHNTSGYMCCGSCNFTAIPRVANLIINCFTIRANIPVIYVVCCAMRNIAMSRC